MVLDIYLIFNAGNPNSLLRLLIADTSWDILVTFIVSLGIVLISFLVFNPVNKENDNLLILLKANQSHIAKLKEKGKTPEEIADSFLMELKLKGIFRLAAKKRVLKYLEELK